MLSIEQFKNIRFPIFPRFFRCTFIKSRMRYLRFYLRFNLFIRFRIVRTILNSKSNKMNILIKKKHFFE